MFLLKSSGDMNRYIDEDELRRFMIKEEVRMVYPLLAEAETGQITRKSLTDWLVRSSICAHPKIYHDNKGLKFCLGSNGFTPMTP